MLKNVDRLGAWLAPKRLALLVGLTAGMLAAFLLHEERREWRARTGGGDQIEVVYISRAVATGSTLQADWLSTRSIPAQAVHPLALRPADVNVVSGVQAAHEIVAGQPVLWSDLADPRASADQMAALVRPNERALSLRVNEVTGVGRLIQNGDHVDIFGTFDRRGDLVTVPILQNVVVIATGRSLHAGGGGDYTTISVSVSPQEAALLVLAQETGRLTYALRNSHDLETVPGLQSVSFSELFEDGKRKTVQEHRDIRVLRGKL